MKFPDKRHCPGCDSTAIEYLGISECFSDSDDLCHQYECAMCGLSWDGKKIAGNVFSNPLFGSTQNDEREC